LSGHKNIRGWVYGSTVGQWIHEGGGHTVLLEKNSVFIIIAGGLS